MDMWAPYVNAVEAELPKADVVHDRYHVSAMLSRAVGQVRSCEHRTLEKAGISPLASSRFVWLKNQKRWNSSEREMFATIESDIRLRKMLVSQTGRAWSITESFAVFWSYVYPGAARRYGQRWYGLAVRCRIDPIRRTAKTLQKNLDRLLTCFHHGITNARTEGMNATVRLIKTNARGFRNFENFRIAILFSCGKLGVHPQYCRKSPSP